MATKNIVPRATGEGGLGTTLKRWATAFIDTLTLTNLNAGSVSQVGGASKILATDASGNLSVGAATAGGRIDSCTPSGSSVVGLMLSQTGTAAGSKLFIKAYNSSYVWDQGAIGFERDAANSNFSLVFYRSLSGTNAEGGRFDCYGNFLVGVTSPLTSEKMSIQSSAAVTTAVVRNSHNTSGDTGLYMELGSNASNTSSYFLNGSITGVGPKIYICGNGNIQNANNSYGAISDKKLKTNITDARDYLNDLCNVRIRKFNFIAEPDAAQQLGVIAQELEEIFPGLVEDIPDMALRQKTDEEGRALYEQKVAEPEVLDEESGEVITPAVFEDDLDKPITEHYLTGETTKSVKYSVFVPMLIKAVQELRKKNDDLELRLSVIEGKMKL